MGKMLAFAAGNWKTSTMGLAVIALGVVEPLMGGEPMTVGRGVLAAVGVVLLLIPDPQRQPPAPQPAPAVEKDKGVSP